MNKVIQDLKSSYVNLCKFLLEDENKRNPTYQAEMKIAYNLYEEDLSVALGLYDESWLKGVMKEALSKERFTDTQRSYITSQLKENLGYLLAEDNLA